MMPFMLLERLARRMRRPVERLAQGFIQPAQGPQVDFGHPVGEPALLASDSLSWVIFKNPVALAVGGVAAVILELAEPRVRTGVWEHTRFRTAPLPRLQRTGLAAMLTVYGPRSQAEAMIMRVNRLHGRVQGHTPDGEPYRADDPDLLAWVQATAAFGFVEAYGRFVRPLTTAQRDQLYEESAVSTRLYGVADGPASVQAMEALFESMRPSLVPSDILLEFLAIMRDAPILPRWLRPAQGVWVKAAVATLPPWARAQLNLGSAWQLSAWQAWLVRFAGAAADRFVLYEGPAAQACRRLGLPSDHLYRSRL